MLINFNSIIGKENAFLTRTVTRAGPHTAAGMGTARGQPSMGVEDLAVEEKLRDMLMLLNLLNNNGR